ncbi:MAG: hypothetical protein HQL17_08625 [Candidatus Omnitrophica bacterium]|nr:hypothetical protein [Candidatus Omnitrophota bacterium]
MKKAQTILEFSAAMVILCVILYGMVEVFRWGMMDMAERRYDHDAVLRYTGPGSSTEGQLNPNFHQTRSMDLLLHSN